MKFVRVGSVGEEVPALLHDDQYWDLRLITDDLSGSFFSSGGEQRSRRLLEGGDLPVLGSAGRLRLGSPITRPGKVVCVGLNYRDHAEETQAQLPEEPLVFLKDPSTVVGPHDEVLIPRQSSKTDWEVELGVVIGKQARYLNSPADALTNIAGYVLSHDVSEREFQIERGGLWDKGKSCETFNPLGPWLVTPDEISDVQSLRMRLWVNDKIRQDSNTSSMIFSVNYLVWYLSQFMVLNPGDLINTGTPAGVALGQPEPRPYLRAGDRVALEIDGLGTATQTLGQA